jgi:hypothetical protein
VVLGRILAPRLDFREHRLGPLGHDLDLAESAARWAATSTTNPEQLTTQALPI